MREITVTVKFVGALSSILDKREYEMSVPEGTNLKQLLNMLCQCHGDAFSDRIWTPQGDLRSDFKVFFGQEDMSTQLDAEVQPGKITLFFLMGMIGGTL